MVTGDVANGITRSQASGIEGGHGQAGMWKLEFREECFGPTGDSSSSSAMPWESTTGRWNWHRTGRGLGILAAVVEPKVKSTRGEGCTVGGWSLVR
jgi:hypothetical protein